MRIMARAVADRWFDTVLNVRPVWDMAWTMPTADTTTTLVTTIVAATSTRVNAWRISDFGFARCTIGNRQSAMNNQVTSRLRMDVELPYEI